MPLSTPNTLVAGAEIDAAPLNENFTAHRNAIVKLEEVIEKLFNKAIAGVTGTELFNTAWGTVAERALATPIEASASRPAIVAGMVIFSTTGQKAVVKVGGITIGEYEGGAGANVVFPIPTFTLKPGEKYEVTGNPFGVRTAHKLV